MRYYLCIMAILTLAVWGFASADVLPAISGQLTLDEAVQTALKYSPMVGAAGDQAEAAQAHVGMAKAMTRPQMSASVFAGNSSMGDIITSPPNVTPPSVFSVPAKGSVTGQVGLMVPLYTGGLLSGAVESTKNLSAAAASDQASAKQNTALETKAAYHRAILAQATVGVYQNLVAEEDERVRIAQVGFDQGKIAKYDLLRNQAGLADAQQQLVNAQRDAQIALVDLKTVLGVSQNSDPTLTDQLVYVPVRDSLDSYTALAIKNRPELAAVRARIKSAGSNVEVAKSAYQPQVYANAMEGVSAASDSANSGLTVGVTVGIPIVDGGLRREAVREAQAMLQAMKQDERQALLGIEQDVNTVWAELQAAEKNTELSDAAIVQADEDYRVIKLRYEAGKAVNVEVLDALASRVRAQNNRLMALYEYSIARDRLARATGTM